MAGYKVRRLATLLQKSFPDRNGLQVVWRPEEIYPARGAWKKKSMDVWSWQAFARYVGEDGQPFGTAYHVGSYATITELIKAPKLVMLGDAVAKGIKKARIPTSPQENDR